VEFWENLSWLAGVAQASCLPRATANGFWAGKMPALRRLSVALSLFAIATGSASAQPPKATLRSHGLVVTYPPGADAVALRACDIADAARKDLDAKLGIVPPSDAALYLCARTEFDRLAAGRLPHAIAFADSRARLMVIDLNSLAGCSNNDLAIVFKHELAHLALDAAVRPWTCPRWFQEGIAEWVSGRLRLDPGDQLRTAASLDALLSLESLSESFPVASDALALAYLESEAFVGFLEQAFGPGALRRIIAALRAKGDFDAAFISVAGQPVSELEARWQKTLKPRFPLLFLLVRSLTLFSAMALLAVLAFIVLLMRRHARMKRWREEEALEAAEDSEQEQQGS